MTDVKHPLAPPGSPSVTSNDLKKLKQFEPNEKYGKTPQKGWNSKGSEPTVVGKIGDHEVELLTHDKLGGQTFKVTAPDGYVTTPGGLKNLLKESTENTQMEELLESTIEGAATGNVNDFRTGVEQALLQKISFRLEEERRVVAEEFFGEGERSRD